MQPFSIQTRHPASGRQEEVCEKCDSIKPHCISLCHDREPLFFQAEKLSVGSSLTENNRSSAVWEARQSISPNEKLIISQEEQPVTTPPRVACLKKVGFFLQIA
jgi:hypothetical protein